MSSSITTVAAVGLEDQARVPADLAEVGPVDGRRGRRPAAASSTSTPSLSRSLSASRAASRRTGCAVERDADQEVDLAAVADLPDRLDDRRHRLDVGGGVQGVVDLAQEGAGAERPERRVGQGRRGDARRREVAAAEAVGEGVVEAADAVPAASQRWRSAPSAATARRASSDRASVNRRVSAVPSSEAPSAAARRLGERVGLPVGPGEDDVGAGRGDEREQGGLGLPRRSSPATTPSARSTAWGVGSRAANALRPSGRRAGFGSSTARARAPRAWSVPASDSARAALTRVRQSGSSRARPPAGRRRRGRRGAPGRARGRPGPGRRASASNAARMAAACTRQASTGDRVRA